jgi:hypothetical protein
VPGYEVESELGRGGMSVVYKARQLALKRTVALKMLVGVFADQTERVRFRTEAEAVARLQHPNIVHVHEKNSDCGARIAALSYLPPTNVLLAPISHAVVPNDGVSSVGCRDAPSNVRVSLRLNPCDLDRHRSKRSLTAARKLLLLLIRRPRMSNPRSLDVLEPTGVTSRMLERSSRIHGVRFYRHGRIIAHLSFAISPVEPGLELLEDHMSHQDQPLIVGAGPVGLGAALFLAGHRAGRPPVSGARRGPAGGRRRGQRRWVEAVARLWGFGRE